MAPPQDPPTSIAIRVKVPPGHVPGGADEFILGADIPVASKIGQIRERIQQAIPSSPTPERQRLLYGGRALVDNDQSVADALNIRRDPTQTEYVIHLLVKGEGASTAPIPHRTGIPTPARSASPAAAARPATVPPAPGPQPAQNAAPEQHGLNNRGYLEAVQQQQIQMHNYMHAMATQAQRQQPPMMHHHQGFMPQMPFQMHPNAGPMPAMPFPLNGFPMQQFPGQQQPVHTNDGQNGNGASNNTAGQQTSAQTQERQPNNDQTAGQLPPRFANHQPGHAQVRIHQTLHIPHTALHAHQRPAGSPHPPGMPSPLGNSNGPSALDRARENITEMRRLIDEMRNSDTLTDEQQARIRSIEERTQHINDYIDPFRTGSIGNNRARSNSPAQNTNAPSSVLNAPSHVPLPPMLAFSAPPNWQQRAHQIRRTQNQSSDTSSDVTCYLISSPNGPYALLHSPQHGIYTGHNGALQPTPTAAHTASNGANANANAQDQANQPGAQGQGEAGQQVQAQAQGQAQAQAAQQDPLGPLGPVLGHLWLLLRVLIFSYFLLGANMGWRRPLALFAIGMGFWMIRMGLLGDGGALRRWWDGIMNDGRPPAGQQRQQQEGEQGQNQQQGDQQGQPAAGNARPGQMPTPEQLAQRLLDEDARAREQARDQRLQWLRGRVRPVERAVALLVASLWPGVGEAYVRAREQEERRRAEEEIAARRREEEERQKKEEEEKQKDEGAQSDEKSAAPAETETTATDASNEVSHGAATGSETAGSSA